MKRSTLLAAATLLASVVACRAPAPEATSQRVQPPPAPAMPAGWSVRSDWVVPDDQRQAIGDKLGAPLLALRNTVYDADGQRVQLNVLLAADAGGAKSIMSGLRQQKSEEALVRKGRVVYELVGSNTAGAQITQARAVLDKAPTVP